MCFLQTTVNGWKCEMVEENTLAQSIRRLIKNAEMIRSDLLPVYNDQLLRQNLRIRPTGGGFSLVSYDHKTPQLGESSLQTIDHLKRSKRDLTTAYRIAFVVG
jgi:hypothetical protein